MTGTERNVHFVSDGVTLSGTLAIPPLPAGLVLFAHGSGSSRFSPRNRFVASVIQRHGLATLLFDLLTAREEEVDAVTAQLRFDVALLGRRLVGAVDWAKATERLGHLPIGCFGSSTGAAAALIAAAERPDVVRAVVSRGGRPDLARDHLSRVTAPALFIVGGADDVVLELNSEARLQLAGPSHLEVVPGATHLFEEPGALETVASLAAEWFQLQLGSAAGHVAGVHGGMPTPGQ